MPRPTLRDLAAAAGVSTAAASYAVNHKSGLSPKTREHVLAVAKRIGYEPDATMTELMAHVAKRKEHEERATLAVITRYEEARYWEKNSSVAAFWNGARARARELGYRVEEFRYDEPGLSPQRLRGILRTRGIQGLLFTMAPQHTEEMRLDFDFEGFAAAMSGICFNDPPINFVVPDHFMNTLMALERTWDLGYRRPLLALPGGASYRTQHRMEAAYHYHVATHAEVEALPIYLSEDYEFAPFGKFIGVHEPDVVICTQGDWHNQLVKRVPAEFGWISMNWMPGEKVRAGIDRRLDEQAGFVVDMVVAVIHRGEAGVPPLRKEVMVPGRFMDGPTLPPRKTAKVAKVKVAKAASRSR